jgi:signal peptide peptidase SppA
MYNAVVRAQEEKPVVVSFGDVAASGGYFVAAPADWIVSSPYTITGSIGVIIGFPVVKRLLSNIEITTESIQTSPNGAWTHLEMGLPKEEEVKLVRMVDDLYEQFKSIVSKGRNMSMEEVEKVAQGQVFTGAQALELHLVDQIGSLTDALRQSAMMTCGPKISNAAKQLESELQGHPEIDLNSLTERLAKALSDQGAKVQIALIDIPEDFEGTIRSLKVEPVPTIITDIIPHINLAGEVLSHAIASTVQTDEDRAAIPLDQPEPDDGVDVVAGPRRITMGALIGMAISSNISPWQLPMFCYWYLARAAGKVGEGLDGGLLDAWFGKVFGGQEVLHGAMSVGKSISNGAGPTFSSKKNDGLNVRLEMPPLQINH